MNRARQKPCVLGLLTIVAALGCAPTMPAIRVAGRFVDLRSDLALADARAVAAEADAFVAAVCSYLRADPPSPRIYVFKNGWNLWLYLRDRCPRFSGRPGACFEDENGGLIIALSAADRGRPRPSGLRHELTHAVIAATSTRPMPWLDEGLAQVLEGGCPPTLDRDRMARLVRTLPSAERRLERLAALSEHKNLERDDYLMAWGFTWFLLHDAAYGRDAIRACLAPPMAGEGARARFQRCLGASARRLAARFRSFSQSADPR